MGTQSYSSPQAVLSKLATPGARERIEWIEEKDGWGFVPAAQEWIFLSSQFRSANRSALPDSFLQGSGFRVLGAVQLEFCACKPRILACRHHPHLRSLPTHLSSLSLSPKLHRHRDKEKEETRALSKPNPSLRASSPKSCLFVGEFLSCSWRTRTSTIPITHLLTLWCAQTRPGHFTVERFGSCKRGLTMELLSFGGLESGALEQL